MAPGHDRAWASTWTLSHDDLRVCSTDADRSHPHQAHSSEALSCQWHVSWLESCIAGSLLSARCHIHRHKLPRVRLWTRLWQSPLPVNSAQRHAVTVSLELPNWCSNSRIGPCGGFRRLPPAAACMARCRSEHEHHSTAATLAHVFPGLARWLWLHTCGCMYLQAGQQVLMQLWTFQSLIQVAWYQVSLVIVDLACSSGSRRRHPHAGKARHSKVDPWVGASGDPGPYKSLPGGTSAASTHGCMHQVWWIRRLQAWAAADLDSSSIQPAGEVPQADSRGSLWSCTHPVHAHVPVPAVDQQLLALLVSAQGPGAGRAWDLQAASLQLDQQCVGQTFKHFLLATLLDARRAWDLQAILPWLEEWGRHGSRLGWGLGWPQIFGVPLSPSPYIGCCPAGQESQAMLASKVPAAAAPEHPTPSKVYG